MLAVGDTIPDGEPGNAWYVVKELVPAQILVLHSTTHLSPAWRNNPRVGAWIDWTWTFWLLPVNTGLTRLRLRVRGSVGPWWLKALVVGVIIPADFIMARSMLRGIKTRAEGSARKESAVSREQLQTTLGESVRSEQG